MLTKSLAPIECIDLLAIHRAPIKGSFRIHRCKEKVVMNAETRLSRSRAPSPTLTYIPLTHTLPLSLPPTRTGEKGSVRLTQTGMGEVIANTDRE